MNQWPTQPNGYPPARGSLWQRYREASPGMRIGLGIATLLASCLLCAGLGWGTLAGIGVVSRPASPTATQMQPSVTGTEVPTLAPEATATAIQATPPSRTPTATTPHPIILSGATLGGTEQGLTAKYGAPSGPDQWTVNGMMFSVNVIQGTDGNSHVFFIAASSTGTTWTLSQAQPICRAFLPPDATHIRDQAPRPDEPQEIYASPDLGATFPQQLFGVAPSGSLFIDYQPPQTGTGVAECKISTGVPPA